MKLAFFILMTVWPMAVLAQEEPVFPQFKWSGDLRIREQWEKDGDANSRLSTRFRARFGLGVQIQKELRAEVRLASARANRSTNQAMGDSGDPGPRRRFIGLDLGYAEWKPADFAKIYAGRFPQIQFRPGGTQIILDDDLTLEGVGAALEYEFYPEFRVFTIGGSTYLRENYDTYYSDDLADNNLNFMQSGLSWTHERFKITLGAAFYNFTSVQGKNFADLATGGKANGNTETAAGVVKNPYLPRQYFLEAKFSLGKWDGSAFFEYIKNHETTDPNQAFWTGVSVGQKKWDLQIGYMEVESDAVLGLFTNSDFFNGVTDGRGWSVTAGWKFQRNMALRLTQFIAHTRMDIDAREYQRTHLDVIANF